MNKNGSLEPKVHTHSRPGNPARLNEDAIVHNPHCRVYGVIDGVSAMDAEVDENGYTGGYIASRLLADELHGSAHEVDLPQAVDRANLRLRQRMMEAGVDLSSKWKRWGAVFAVFRVHETYVEFAQCGDCMLFARYGNGAVRVLTRNQVAAFDWNTLQAKQRLMSEGVTQDEVRAAIASMAKHNRSLANTPEGYSVMNGDPAFGQFVEYGRISTANLAKVYALTDGMFHFIEYDEDPGKWERLLARLDEWGLENEMDHLFCLENLDPHCTQYPRHKKSDDKSAVIVDFSL